MNSHGADAVDEDGILALKHTAVSDGGAKDFIKTVTETATEYDEYTSTYQYGIIMRDYVALQVAEYIADINNTNRTINTTVNGGTVGWLKDWTSAIEDEEEINLNNALLLAERCFYLV